jgi:hypothetical protein
MIWDLKVEEKCEKSWLPASHVEVGQAAYQGLSGNKGDGGFLKTVSDWFQATGLRSQAKAQAEAVPMTTKALEF